jgi:hypothetical protein
MAGLATTLVAAAILTGCGGRSGSDPNPQRIARRPVDRSRKLRSRDDERVDLYPVSGVRVGPKVGPDLLASVA